MNLPAWLLPSTRHPLPIEVWNRLHMRKFTLDRWDLQYAAYKISFPHGKLARFTPQHNCKVEEAVDFEIDLKALEAALLALEEFLKKPLDWDNRDLPTTNTITYAPDAIGYIPQNQPTICLNFIHGEKSYSLTTVFPVILGHSEELSHEQIELRLHARYGTPGLGNSESRIHLMDEYPLEWLISHGHLMPGTTSAQLAERRARFQGIVELNLIFNLFERACPIERFADFSQPYKGIPGVPAWEVKQLYDGIEQAINHAKNNKENTPLFPIETLALTRKGAWNNAEYTITLFFPTNKARIWATRDCKQHGQFDIQIDSPRLDNIMQLLDAWFSSGVIQDPRLSASTDFHYQNAFTRLFEQDAHKQASEVTFELSGKKIKMDADSAPPFDKIPIYLLDWIHSHYQPDNYREIGFPNHSFDANAIKWMLMRKALDFQKICEEIERCVQLEDYVDVNKRPKQTWTKEDLKDIYYQLPRVVPKTWSQRLRDLFSLKKVRDPRWSTYPFVTHPHLPAWNAARFGRFEIETMNALYSAHYAIELSADKGSLIHCRYHCRQEGRFALAPAHAQLNKALALLAEWVAAHPDWDKDCLEKLNFRDFFADPILFYDRVGASIFHRMRLNIDGHNYQVRSPFHLSFPPDVPLSMQLVADGFHAAFGFPGEDGITRRIHAMDDHPLEWLIMQGHQPLGTTQAELDARRRQFQQVVSFNYVCALIERACHVEQHIRSNMPEVP